jgi:RNA polymerase sigma factor (sigma-70 family)
VDEAAVITGLRRGDPAAFDAAFAAYRPRIYAFLVRLTRRRDLAEDLLQETFLRLARHALRLAEDTNLRAWLFTVARNQVRSYLRWAILDAERLRDLGLWPRGEPSSPFDDAAGGETERGLERAIAALPLRYREVILLCAVEGLAHDQVARMLGLRPDALRQRLARARAMIEERLPAAAAERRRDAARR